MGKYYIVSYMKDGKIIKKVKVKNKPLENKTCELRILPDSRMEGLLKGKEYEYKEFLNRKG